MISKETYCELPFKGVFLNTNGDVKFCCALNKPLGNISDKSLSEIMQGEIASEIRKSILNNQWHDYCSVCKQAEKQSGSSQRSFSIRPDNFEKAKLIENEFQFNIESIDVRWSNTCNLSCVYCFSGASSKWASILNEYVVRPSSEEHQKFLSDIVEHATTIKSVNLLGGEPLLEKFNENLLIALHDYPNISYNVLSNLSIPEITTNRIFQLLNKNDSVTWAVSFETIGERYDYVRNGSSWDLFQNNVRTVYEITNKKLLVHFTYCIYSATRLVEFFDYVSSVPWFKKIIIQQLVTPSYLNVSMQNEKIRDSAIQEISICVDKYHEMFPEEMQQLIEIRQALLDLPFINSSEHFNKIKNTETILSKKIGIYELWPELAESLAGDHHAKTT